MTATRARELKLGSRRLPVVLPNRRDPRLHLASVVISIHIIGITALNFRVSVPQILTAIVAAAAVDVGFTLVQSKKLVWPASGMLTGSGVALILRLVTMDSHDYWSWQGWHYFALISAASVLTKYVIRFRGQHLFNPSNVGLVVAFLVLGTAFIEPLDFWWAPLNGWMALAYTIIIVGGVLITRRLRLLEMAVVFWVAFSASLAVLAASGHCMTAAWSLTPVCGARFWTVLVTSPEILVFLFFMITDPKTVPSGRGARAVFAGTLALVCVALIAPQTTEFGAKVALLGSLVLWSPIRSLFDRLVPDTDRSRLGTANLVDRIGGARPHVVFARGTALGAVLALVGTGIVAAGSPARPLTLVAQPAEAATIVDPASLPQVVLDPDVATISGGFDQEDASAAALTLAENLAIEGRAIREGDGSLLGGADAGERLSEMQQRLDAALATGDRIVDEYRFATMSLLMDQDREGQTGVSLMIEGTGTKVTIHYDALGAEQSRRSTGFAATFILRQIGGDRWLIVAVVQPDE